MKFAKLPEKEMVLVTLNPEQAERIILSEFDNIKISYIKEIDNVIGFKVELIEDTI